LDETGASLKRALRARWVIWSVMVAAYMVVFFHRLAAGVVRVDLVRDFSLSASAFGSLAAMYFYAYMAMQVPVGMLADTLGARATVTAGMIIAGAGSALFGLAPSPGLLFVGRFLVGIGVSTVFVSILKIQSQWFREREFATMSGVTALIGNLGGVLAQAPLALAVAAFTWRATFLAIGLFSGLLAVLCWVFIRNRPQDRGWPPLNEAQVGITPPRAAELMTGLRGVVRRWRTWPAFLLSGCASGLYLAFSGAWGTSFLKDVYGMERMAASGIVSYSVYGGMAGCLLAGWFSDKIGLRRPPLLLLSTGFCACWAALVFWGGGKPPEAILRPLFFLLGFSASSYMLAWSITKETNLPRFTAVAISVVNTGSFLGTALITTAMGMILDHTAALDAAGQYRAVFLFCLACSVLGLFCATLLQETRCRNVTIPKQA
jgi:sugar phosphate permease